MSTSTAERRLIVNADDFGQDASFNAGTARAHDEGIVTSASLMVRWPGAVEAAALAAARPALSLGIHLDLGEWSCVAGEWFPLYEVVDVADADAVDAEVTRQLEAFSRLVGRPPTHLDSHQHAHREDPVTAVARRAADRLVAPLRGLDDVAYCGSFYGQWGRGEPYPVGVTVEHLVTLVEQLPEGTTEVGCHPGIGRPALGTMYAAERELETAALCDPRVRAALDRCGVRLTSFRGASTP